MRGGAESALRGPTPRLSTGGISRSGLRATASLNRVLDTAKKATRRNSLFGSTVLSNATCASELPRGPERFEHDGSESGDSPKHTNPLYSGQWSKNNPGSKRFSPLSKRARASIEAVRVSNESGRSSCTMEDAFSIVVPRHSPPPSIHFDLQIANFVDPQLMEAVGLNQADFAAAGITDAESPPAAAIAQRSRDQVDVTEQNHQVYLPSRNTTDHWRTSKGRLISSTHARTIQLPTSRLCSTTTGSLLNLDNLLTSDDSKSTKNDGQTLSAMLSPTDGAQETIRDPSLFEQARARFSAGARKASSDSLATTNPSIEVTPPSSPFGSWRKSPSKTNLDPSPRTPQSRQSPYSQTSKCSVKAALQRVCETPSPGKALILPLRPKWSIVEDTSAFGGHAGPASAQDPSPLLAAGTCSSTQPDQQTSEDSPDELLDPLTTQDLFTSDSEDDNSGYALGLNDLVEKATREIPTRGSSDVQKDFDTPRDTDEDTCLRTNAALNTLSDLKRLRPFREKSYRDSLPFLKSQKSAERRFEMIKLEREAFSAVFPGENVPDHGDSGSDIPRSSNILPPSPGANAAQDRELERQVHDLFFSGVQGSAEDLEDSLEAQTRTASSHAVQIASPSTLSDSACVIPVCQTCGSRDPHVCEMVPPSNLASYSVTSSSSMEDEDACPQPVQLLSSPASATRAQGNIGSRARDCPMSISSHGKTEECSLQRKKSDPLGLELHRLGDQAAEWLQSLSPGSKRRFMPEKVSADGPGKLLPVPWGLVSPRNRSGHKKTQPITDRRDIKDVERLRTGPGACPRRCRGGDEMVAMKHDKEEA